MFTWRYPYGRNGCIDSSSATGINYKPGSPRRSTTKIINSRQLTKNVVTAIFNPVQRKISTGCQLKKSHEKDCSSLVADAVFYSL
jgi:hypothetical protein